MTVWRPDPTFYPSPRSAMTAPPEELAYVIRINPTGDDRPDAIAVIDTSPTSRTYGTKIGEVEMSSPGDELHHFGWNACSSMLCPSAAHPHVERRYLIVPALGSSRIYVIDTKPDPPDHALSRRSRRTNLPNEPAMRKVIPFIAVWMASISVPWGLPMAMGPAALSCSITIPSTCSVPGRSTAKTNIFTTISGGILAMTRWSPVNGAPRTWWKPACSRSYCSRGNTGTNFISGICATAPDPDDRSRKEHQIVLELRPAHDPTQPYGFVNSVLNLNDLSSAIWRWNRNDDGTWEATKIIEIPAEPAEEEQLPPALKPFKAVPPLVTDIALSLDDRFLYVSCWGTGELRQYDVSDPADPKLTGSIRLGGIVRQAGHPAVSGPLNGAPQMVELSRDGQRIYFTNSLYLPWDAQFYPDGIKGWMAMATLDSDGGMSLDADFFVDFGDQRPHQVRLQGGDASTDSFCFA